MTLLEPVLLGTFVGYVFTPIATYALGFDPSLTIGYVALFALAPLALGILTFAPVTFVFTALFDSGMSPAGRIATVSATILFSEIAFVGSYYFLHRPATALEVAALVVASPWIAAVSLSAVAAGLSPICGAAYAVGRWLFSVRGKTSEDCTR
jgi:hypothetical protein